MEKLFFALAFVGFVTGAISVAWDFELASFFCAMLNMFLLFLWALKIDQNPVKTYRWLCSYSIKNGSGRIFITAETNKLSEPFVLAVEKLVTERNEGNPCHVLNLQLMSE